MHIHTPSLFTTFSLIYTNYDFSSAISRDQSGTPSNFESTSRIRDYLVRSEAQWFPDEHHAVKAGAELTRHNLLVSASDVGDVPLGRFLNQSNLVSVEGAAYVQDEWKISALLTGNLGARLSYFSDGKYLFVEPRVSAAYALSDSWRLKGSFSVSHQFLHLIVRNDVSLPTDLWFSSTPSILPGESLQSVFGVESSFLDGRYLFTIEAYYKSLRHLYEYRDNARFSFGSPLEEQFTSGNGEAYGIEVFLSKRVGAFTGWIGYTLAWTKETFPDLNEGRTFYPRYDRRHDISAVLTYTLGEHWEFGATWTYGTGQAYTFPTGQYSFPPLIEGNPPLSTTPGFSFSSYDYSQRNGYRLPPFHKLDLNFVHKYTWFGLPFQFSINVYNAYNRRNPFAQEFSGIRNGVPTVHQFTLFPIIPSFGLSVKF
jgi:hypothetical protein